MFKPKKGAPFAWRPSLLRPEIARLVARPYLVLGFGNHGGTPVEYARKRAAIVNGAGSKWISSPVGPGLHFTNAVIGTPTDYVSFASGAYPTVSSLMVPHSIAVLWRPTANPGFGHYPFLTADSGNGMWFHAQSGSGFDVTHGGIIGFPSIGAAMYALNHIYLQLYSYDLVTMNHLVLDLNTGQSAAQSVGETRALTISNGPKVGRLGSNQATQGDAFGVAWVAGAWSMREMEMIAREPTSIWTPRPKQRITYKVPAGGGGTINSGAGAAQSGATAVGAGTSIAAAAAVSPAPSTAAASGAAIATAAPSSATSARAVGVGVAIAAAAASASSLGATAGSGAARAEAAGQSTSSSVASGSNNNVAQATGIAIATSLGAGAAAAIAAGDGRSVAAAPAAGSASAIAGGTGQAWVASIVRAIAASIAAAFGWSTSLTRAVGDVSPPFDASTLVRAPHYLDFVRLETRLEFVALAVRMSFLSSDGAEEMNELRLIEGENRDVEFVVRGAGNAPLDLTGATSQKLTVGIAGETPTVNAVDLVVVGPTTDGRLRLPAGNGIANAAGRYKALTVIGYPGGVVVKSPGTVLVDSAIA